MNLPFFSIIIPTYNRARLLERAIESCRRQAHADFEVLVVDDASTDDTADVVARLRDERLRYLRQPRRRGVGPARNAAVAAARGQWFVFLDSDDELAPNALELMRREIDGLTDPRIAQIRFNCIWDDGRMTPTPPLQRGVWDYETYLKFLDSTVGGSSETMACVRADTFREVRYPENRAYETGYHMDFARRYLTLTVPEIARVYHTDAGDQLTRDQSPAYVRAVAPDMAATAEAVLGTHGPALRRFAPKTYLAQLRGAAKNHFLAGDRARGVARIAQYLRLRPTSAFGWGILIGGILGARALVMLDGVRGLLRRPRAAAA